MSARTIAEELRRIAPILAGLALAGCGAEAAPAPSIPVGGAGAEPPGVTAAAASGPAASSAAAAPSASATGAAAPVESAEPRAEPALPAVEVVASPPAPTPDPMPSLAILAPAKNQLVAAAKAAAFEVKLTAKGARLEGGDHLCVRIDKHPCRRVADIKKKLTLAEIDPTIDEGQHVITVLARRASGESIKPAGKRVAFASHSFYVGKKAPPVWKDGGPMVLFDAPDDAPAPAEGVLLDFYVANAEVARGKQVIHASVGGPGLGPGTAMVLDSTAPLRIKNARPGEYVVRLSLFGYRAELGESSSSTTVSVSSAPVPGPFSEVTRSFRVTEPTKAGAR